MAVLIRKCVPEDARAIASIYAPYVHDTQITFDEIAPTVRQMRERIATTLVTYPFLIAELDAQVVGYSYASAHRPRASFRWHVDVAVYVQSGLARRGIGRALYGQLFPILKRQGFVHAYAGITIPNAASEALHRAFGFAHVATFEDAGFKLGKWWNAGWWVKELNDTSAAAAEPVPLSQLGDIATRQRR